MAVCGTAAEEGTLQNSELSWMNAKTIVFISEKQINFNKNDFDK